MWHIEYRALVTIQQKVAAHHQVLLPYFYNLSSHPHKKLISPCDMYLYYIHWFFFVSLLVHFPNQRGYSNSYTSKQVNSVSLIELDLVFYRFSDTVWSMNRYIQYKWTYVTVHYISLNYHLSTFYPSVLNSSRCVFLWISLWHLLKMLKILKEERKLLRDYWTVRSWRLTRAWRLCVKLSLAYYSANVLATAYLL